MDDDKYSVIEFDDYYAEWLIPLAIARENGESNPILVARGAFFPAKYETHERPWHLPFTDKLKLLMSFPVPAGEYEVEHRVFEIIDIDAYHLIWLRLSSDHSIADYVFSSDVDLNLLQKKLVKNARKDILLEREDFKQLATWSYWQKYGGGADEHFAFFQSNRPENIRSFNRLLNATSFTERYQGIRSLGITTEDARYFIETKLKHHCQEYCYLLFRRAPILDIRTQEDYEEWHRKHEAGEPCSEDDFRNTLAYVSKANGLLKTAMSIQAAAEIDHGEYRFKVLPLHDPDFIIETLLGEEGYLVEDFIDGFFSADTDIAALEKRFSEGETCIAPEALLHLGEWALVRSRDLYEGSYVLSVTDPADLARFISNEKKAYQLNEVNTKPVFYE